MGAGKRQKGNKKISNIQLKNRIIGVGLKKDEPMAPINKVRTAVKPNCNKTVHVKKGSARVNPKRITTCIENEDGKIKSDICVTATSHAPGGGTEVVDFVTEGVKVNVENLLNGCIAGTAELPEADGAEAVDFATEGVKVNVANLIKGDGTDIVDFLIKEDK